MAAITFRFGGGEIRTAAQRGETLLEAARRAGVDIDAPCSGGGVCGKCRVRLLSGALESAQSRHISAGEYAGGWRLACGSRVVSDAVIEVPDAASAWRGGMRVAGLSTPAEQAAFRRARADIEAAGMAFGCGIASVAIEMDAPTLEDTLPDNERAALALSAATGAERVRFSLHALRKLPRVLRENGFRLRCIVESEPDGVNVLDALSPGDDTPAAGAGGGPGHHLGGGAAGGP